MTLIQITSKYEQIYKRKKRDKNKLNKRNLQIGGSDRWIGSVDRWIGSVDRIGGSVDRIKKKRLALDGLPIDVVLYGFTSRDVPS